MEWDMAIQSDSTILARPVRPLIISLLRLRPLTLHPVWTDSLLGLSWGWLEV